MPVRRRHFAVSRRACAVARGAICAAILLAPPDALAQACDRVSAITQVSSTFAYVFQPDRKPQYVQITILAQAAQRQADAVATDPELAGLLGAEASRVAASLSAIAGLEEIAKRSGPDAAAEAARAGDIAAGADALSAAIGRICAADREDASSEDRRGGGLDAAEGAPAALGEAVRTPEARTLSALREAPSGGAGAPGAEEDGVSKLVAVLRYASPFVALALVFAALIGLKRLYDAAYAALHSRRWCVIPAELSFDGYALDGRITIIGTRGFRFAPTQTETADLVSFVTAEHFYGVVKIGPFEFDVVFEARSPARCVCYFVEPLASETVEALLELSLARPSICTAPPPPRSRARAKTLVAARDAHLKGARRSAAIRPAPAAP